MSDTELKPEDELAQTQDDGGDDEVRDGHFLPTFMLGGF